LLIEKPWPWNWKVFIQQSTIINQQLPMTARTRTDVLLLAGFCAFLFFYGLGAFGLIGADEPRYAQVAREMLERHEWITPTLGGHPWLEKPPLYYWQAMLAYSVLGVSDVATRVPSAIDATLLVIAVYLFFRRFRRGVEVDAALITASCAGVVGYARAASMDMALAASFSIGMLAWWGWRESGKRIYLAAFYMLMALGTLAKGPVAPFLAAIVILLYALAVREWRFVARTLWLPGVLLFCVVALPWYVAVEMRNPQFFREFILQHNLARFSSDLYHHRQPFWYYLPVTLLALAPWTVFVVAAFVESVRAWWAERTSARDQGRHPERSRSSGGAKDLASSAHDDGPREIPRPAGKNAGLRDDAPVEAEVRTEPPPDLELQLSLFACVWLAVPVVFFSLSQSKLPGYILPAVPAGAALLADYLRRHLEQQEPVSKWLAVLHALVATAPIVPAVLIARVVIERRLPGGRPTLVAFVVAFVLCAAIALTLASRLRLRMLRFVTLIPVVLAVAAVLKLGTAAIDQTLSARPLAAELASMETHELPVAVCGTSRELEYGLAFYRNQTITRCEFEPLPRGEHLLVAATTWKSEVSRQTAGRRVTFLGHYAPQDVDYYWVTAAGAKP
jgi:4-amino-4-deoxy-L-arabinose transferase-like glycosyltransferase